MSVDAAQASRAILDGESFLAEEIVRLQYERQPGLAERFGRIGHEKTLEDTRYSLKYLVESVSLQSPLLFSSYMTWLRVLLIQYKVSTEDLYINMLCLQNVLGKHLAKRDYELVSPYIDAALRQLDTDAELTDSHLDSSAAADEARAYLSMLLQGDRSGASRLIMGLVDGGMPLQTIYLEIFQKSQYEIGRLWQLGRLTVAQEHYCSAATQLIMSQLFPYLFHHSRKGKKLVAACVGGELHEIGLRMVTDIFELNGWDTYYVGANMPIGPLIRSLKEYGADVLAISCTMTYHVGLVKELIAEVRRDPECDGIRILVGGFPFNIDPELWEKVGADGYGRDAEESVLKAGELTKR